MPRAQYLLGTCYETGDGVEKKPKYAVYMYQQAAQQGHAEAMVRLGICYETGSGVAQAVLALPLTCTVRRQSGETVWLCAAWGGCMSGAQASVGTCVRRRTCMKKASRQTFPGPGPLWTGSGVHWPPLRPPRRRAKKIPSAASWTG